MSHIEMNRVETTVQHLAGEWEPHPDGDIQFFAARLLQVLREQATEGHQMMVDAMVQELHEVLDDADQSSDPNAAVRVWAIRDVLKRWRVTTEQMDDTDWAAVARESPDFTTADTDPTPDNHG